MKAFFKIATGNVGRQLLAFFTQLLLAERLGIVSFGEYGFAFAIYFICAGVADFGTRLYCWQKIAKEDKDKKKLAIELFINRTIITILFTLIYSIIGLALSDSVVNKLIRLFALAYIFNQVFVDWILLAFEKYEKLFLYHIYSGLIYFASIWIFIKDSASYWIVPIAFSISYLAAAILVLGKYSNICHIFFKLNDGSITFLGIYRILKASWREFIYDFFQRVYGSYYILLCWHITTASYTGTFKIITLVYGFAVGIMVYFAMSKFNNVILGKRGAEQEIYKCLKFILISSSLGYLLLPAICNAIEPYIPINYHEVFRSLIILYPVTIIMMIGAFIRELMVACGNIRISIFSYVGIFISAPFAILGAIVLNLGFLQGILVAEIIGLGLLMINKNVFNALIRVKTLIAIFISSAIFTAWLNL